MSGDPALEQALRAVLTRLAEGAALPREHAGVATLSRALADGEPLPRIEAQLRALSRAGYLRGALVSIAAHSRLRPRPEVLLLVAHELCDALAPDLGVELGRALLTLPAVEASRWTPGGPYVGVNMLLGEALLDGGDALAALRHFEGVLAVDLDHARALRGYNAAIRRIGGRAPSRGLALLDGLDEVELAEGLGVDRYELGRPLGRGRHAVVYQAYDRRVGREVAIKRLVLDGEPGRGDARVLGARFFAEARTLARVRSPHVVALLDVQPAHRFIALSLCRGGNLRVAMRRRLLGPAHLAQVGAALQHALAAVHAAGAVHRDVKPANILVREAREGSPIALADFGLAQHDARGATSPAGPAGTLRYLAPELRGAADGRPPAATPASDRFSAGVVLLELALYPAALPGEFDHVGGDFTAEALVPGGLPDGWTDRLRRLLATDPAARTFTGA